MTALKIAHSPYQRPTWVDNGQAVPAENNDTVFIHVDGLKVSRGAAEQGSHGHAMRIASSVGLSQAAAP